MAKIPTKILARIDYWESKGLTKMKSTKSKIYKETVNKLTQLVEHRGVFADTNYTMPDFKLAVDRHHLQVTDEHYFPTNKKTIKYLNLSTFLHSPFMMGRYKSLLIKNIELSPIPVNIRKGNMALYKAVAEMYIKEANNGIKTLDDLSVLSQVSLANTANQISRYYKERKEKLDSTAIRSPKQLAVLLIKAARSMTKNDSERFSANLLTRKWVWEQFPNYLNKNGFLAPQKTFSIYN